MTKHTHYSWTLWRKHCTSDWHFCVSISSFRFQLLFHFHFICLANVVVCHKAIVSKLFGSQVCLPHQLQFFFLSLVHRSSITPTCARLAAYSMSSYCLKEMLSKAPPGSAAGVKAILELLSLSLVKGLYPYASLETEERERGPPSKEVQRTHFSHAFFIMNQEWYVFASLTFETLVLRAETMW